MVGLWQDIRLPMLGIPNQPLHVTLEDELSKGSPTNSVVPSLAATPQPKPIISRPKRKPPVRRSTASSKRIQHDRETTITNNQPAAIKKKLPVSRKIAVNKSFDHKPADRAPKDAPVNEDTPSIAPGSQVLAHAGRISAAVKKRLAAYFEYPLMARLRGWEGEVLLSVHLDPNGSMSNIAVTRSSGYRILDRSALKSAKKAKGIPAVIGWLAGRHFDMVVPIHYQLIGS